MHHLALRKSDGTRSGSYVVIAGVDAYQAIQYGALDFVPVLSGRQELPLFMFGEASSWYYLVLVSDIQQQGSDRVSATVVNYTERVYANDNNGPV